ncbi:phosphoglycerate dehydrogenase-like enzyme [Microbacterium resistens]|uniref:Phosphoglycerate dehydrogenase-like enzyme n=1 Tax=Microbacterium resistens TaxID=156977 RepID=A0ABU1SFC2_9MICO|nr:hydroxyacid dehydrogenase [Microbacterium resistens]MDR6868277.1 phosphoglycerate dehydrogenase-like enzyme [Microbacterium resistens]
MSDGTASWVSASARQDGGSRPTVLFAMPAELHSRVFDANRLRAIAERADVLGVVQEFDSAAAREALARTDVLITGWDAPLLDTEVLDRAPRLRAVLHAGGTVKHHLTSEVWSRGIVVSSAVEANSVPVAQFAVAMILLAGKRVLPIAERYRRERTGFDVEESFPGMGNVDKRVGIVGASRIGRRVIELLAPFGYEIVVFDPYLDPSEAEALGVRGVELEELIATSDIVSIHAPSLPETRHMIDARLIGLLAPGATLINTARGELVDQDALIARILRGDLFAILDVTTPWVLDEDNPLYAHENVMLTPHIAGSLGTELRGLADVVIAELDRYRAGEPLRHPVRVEELARTA